MSRPQPPLLLLLLHVLSSAVTSEPPTDDGKNGADYPITKGACQTVRNTKKRVQKACQNEGNKGQENCRSISKKQVSTGVPVWLHGRAAEESSKSASWFSSTTESARNKVGNIVLLATVRTWLWLARPVTAGWDPVVFWEMLQTINADHHSRNDSVIKGRVRDF